MTCQCGCGQRPRLRRSRFCQGHHARRQFGTFAGRWRHRVRKTDGCWFWTGAVDNSGYARVAFGLGSKKRRGVHVVAWEMENQRRVPDGMVVRHTCDQPLCVRPDHLVVGTQAQNIADRDARGKAPRGERNPAAKLTAHQVGEIRRRPHKRRASVAREFGVSESTIKQIWAGIIWRGIGEAA